jgi:antitoxin HigA-1
MRVSHVVTGARPITADLALRFGKALGQSPEYWLNLQAAYDLATITQIRTPYKQNEIPPKMPANSK